MKWTKNGEVLWCRLELGEEVMSGLSEFLEAAGVKSGTLIAIGALKDTELGYLDVEKGEYQRHTFAEEMELIQFTGNVTTVDGKPFVHAHAVIAGADFIARAGHFFQGTVAVTFECQLFAGELKLGRSFDEATGLKLIDL